MALNFNLLAQEGPKNFYEGFEQGRQAVAQNALAQQKLAQEGEMMSMRRQEFQANLESLRAERRRKATVEKTALFRDRILRAPTPQAARELVRMQHSDPDLGPVMQQLGSLDQDLADIPDDPTGFENWRQREAMGAAEFIKSQASERGFQDLLARVRGGQQGAAVAPAMPSSAPGAMAAPSTPAEPETGIDSYGKPYEAARPNAVAPPNAMGQAIAPSGRMGAEMPLAQANTLAPPAAAPVNAMLAAQPAGRGRTPEQIRAEIDQLNMSNMSNDARVVRMVQTLTKEYEAALRGDQNRPVVVGNRLVSPTGQELYAAPERTDTDLIRNFNAAKAQGFRGNLFDYQREIAMASRPPAPPRQEPPPQPPVAVIDPASGNTIFVSREEALNRRMTPAGQGVSLTPKQMQTFEAKYPQATAAVKTFESKADRLAADLETLANHPGLSGISGLIYGRTPAITAEARQAEALYDSIIARGGFQELQDMRAASPTGGALGPVSNTENQYLRDAFAPIKRTQDTPDLKQALLNAAQATNDSKQRIREAYDLTYEYRARRGDGAAAAPPAPAASPAPAAPKVGTVQQGYRFKGGDPADKKNWEKQ
jgi:hypothetical protein